MRFVVDKLLALVEVATRESGGVDEELLDSYVFLLERGHKIDFGYNFDFAPMPYSQDLRETLFGLEYSGYLAAGSIKITLKGEERVRERQSSLPEFREIYDRIDMAYAEISAMDREQLYDAIFAKLA